MRITLRLGTLMSVSALVVGVLAVSASNALAVQQLTASGGAETGALRDSLTSPAAPSSDRYGTDALLENTVGALALTINPSGTTVQAQVSPQYDAYLGLKLDNNPTAANCSVADGNVEFADFQDSTSPGILSGAESPTYANTLDSEWRVEINSNMCTTNPDKVTTSGAGLWFPTLDSEATGTFTGTYVQSSATCPAGGIELDLSQPAVLINGLNENAGIDDGTAGQNAYLCVISANNYVYPTSPSGPGSLTGVITNN